MVSRLVIGYMDALDWRATNIVSMSPAAKSCDLCGIIPNKINTLPCAHSFCDYCYACIEEQNEHRCCIDGSKFSLPGPCREEQAADITACCWNAAYGCGFVGPITALLDHYARSCSFHFITCPRCHQLTLQSKMLYHFENDCSPKQLPTKKPRGKRSPFADTSPRQRDTTSTKTQPCHSCLDIVAHTADLFRSFLVCLHHISSENEDIAEKLSSLNTVCEKGMSDAVDMCEKFLERLERGSDLCLGEATLAGVRDLKLARTHMEDCSRARVNGEVELEAKHLKLALAHAGLRGDWTGAENGIKSGVARFRDVCCFRDAFTQSPGPRRTAAAEFFLNTTDSVVLSCETADVASQTQVYVASDGTQTVCFTVNAATQSDRDATSTGVAEQVVCGADLQTLSEYINEGCKPPSTTDCATRCTKSLDSTSCGVTKLSDAITFMKQTIEAIAWRVPGFADIKTKANVKGSARRVSDTFVLHNYTARLQVRLKVADDKMFLQLYFIMCCGPADDELEWPFVKRHRLILVHPENFYQSISCENDPTSVDCSYHPLVRPGALRKVGWGNSRMCDIQKAEDEGFVVDDLLTVAVEVFD